MIDRVLEDFELAWRAGNPQDIEDFLIQSNVLSQNELLTALIAAEIELAWRLDRSHPAATRTGDGLVAYYRQRFPSIVGWDAATREIVRSEFLSRQMFGEKPLLDNYVGNLVRPPEDYRGMLQWDLVELANAKVRVFANRSLALELQMSATIEFGRQRLGEPDPINLASQSGRVIISNAENVSRRAMLLELVSQDCVCVHNLSSRHQLQLNDTHEVPPQSGVLCRLAVSIELGDVLIVCQQ